MIASVFGRGIYSNVMNQIEYYAHVHGKRTFQLIIRCTPGQNYKHHNGNVLFSFVVTAES